MNCVRRWLLGGVDLGLIGIILLTPLVMGGRIALGRFVFIVLAFSVAVLWCLRQCLVRRATWVGSSMNWLLLLGVVLAAIQITPLPQGALNALSPQVGRVLPLWGARGDALWRPPDSWPAGPQAATPLAPQGARLGDWNTISLVPSATRDNLMMLWAFACLFLVTLQRVRGIADIERFLRNIALAAVAMAGFALLQHFTCNGKYFWFFDYPIKGDYPGIGEVVTGGFTNRNHFAQYMALGLGPLAWWTCRASVHSGTTAALRAVALGLSTYAGMMSLSRGGLGALAVAVVVFVVFLWPVFRPNSWPLPKKLIGQGAWPLAAQGARLGWVIRGRTLVVLASAALLSAACLGVYGYARIADRVEDFSSLDKLDQWGSRRKLWAAANQTMRDFPLFGVGLGGHRQAYPLYFQETSDSSGKVVFTHAENSYLQVGMETGIIGLVLALSAVGLCAYWCLSTLRRNRHLRDGGRRLLCLSAIAASLAANFTHAMVDFIWYVPGCMANVVILAACACRLWQIQPLRGDPTQDGAPHRIGPARATGIRVAPRRFWVAGAIGLAAIGAAVGWSAYKAVRAEAAWFRYLRLSDRLVRQKGAWPLAKKLLGQGARPTETAPTLQGMKEELDAVIHWKADHPDGHARMAAVHASLFEHGELATQEALGEGLANSMGLAQIRDAAVASHFPSSKALQDWLLRAFGARKDHLKAALSHAHKAVRICPLQGEAYLLLAELSFLDGPKAPPAAAYVRQALRVRPHDGKVLFLAGREAGLAGDLEQAFQLWRKSFASGEAHQRRVLDHLASRIAAPTLLKILHPDVQALEQILVYYQQAGVQSDLSVVWKRYARLCEDQGLAKSGTAAGGPGGQEASPWWAKAARAHSSAGAYEKSLACLRRAVDADSLNYTHRRALGMCLYSQQRYAEAQKQLAWCLARNPHDEKAQQLWTAALRQTASPKRVWAPRAASGPKRVWATSKSQIKGNLYDTNGHSK